MTTSSYTASPAKAGAQSRGSDWLGAVLCYDNLRDWAPAFAGEGRLK
jgi:hypothetical protein